MNDKYEVTQEFYTEDDGWINKSPSITLARFRTRKEAEKEYGRFYDRLPIGKAGQELTVKALWRLDRGEVLGYVICK